MGEVREGEAAYRWQTIIARFPHPNPRPCWRRGNGYLRSSHETAPRRPMLGPTSSGLRFSLRRLLQLELSAHLVHLVGAVLLAQHLGRHFLDVARIEVAA